MFSDKQNFTEERLREELLKLEKQNNLRTLKSFNEEILNLSSNDYLGIATDSNLKKEFFEIYGMPSFSSSSSRLLSGNYSLIQDLEIKLKEIYNKDALVFNTGFDANQCFIETLFHKDALIISDKLNHASIYSGILSTESKFIRYPHFDYDKLESILKKERNNHKEVLIITETIYSMDGDLVDLKRMVEIKKKYNCKLLIDEAHSYGVYGYGLAYSLNLINEIDYITIPLGKGGGSIGAFLLTNEITKSYIINKGKKFIYTTAPAPINTAWNLFILEKMSSFKERIDKLESLVRYTLEKLKFNGIESQSTTQIITVIIGNNDNCQKISDSLLNKGYLILPIKEPTVPKGSSRIRIGLNPNFTHEQIDQFIKELKFELNNLF